MYNAPAQPPTSFTLTGQTPPYTGYNYSGQGSGVVIGRGDAVQIRIADAQLSRHHARFNFINGQWYVEDLGSTNGTFVNRQPAGRGIPVNAGSVINIGPYSFVFQPAGVYVQPQVPPPPPPRFRPGRPRKGRVSPVLYCGGTLTILLLISAAVVLCGLPFLGINILPENIAIWLNPSQWAPGTGYSEVEDALSETGFTIQAEDGASVEFPPYYGESGISATLTKVTDASGELLDEDRVVSGEYLLELSDVDRVSSDLFVSIPITQDLLQGGDPSGLYPLAFIESTGEWVPVGTLIEYDAAANTLRFDLSFTEAVIDEQASYSGGVLAARVYAPESQYKQTRVKLIIVDSYFSSWVTTESPASRFRIKYDPRQNLSQTIKNDEWWNSQTGYAVNPDIPDYIEDLDAALNMAYEELLKVQQISGNLFQPLSEPVDVIVKNTGEVDGKVNLTFGWIYYSNYRLRDWTHMRQVAGHELTHLLQDQHYNTVNASNNKWFFEACADYFSARANRFAEAERGKIYIEGGIKYLQVPLTSSSAQSMYTAAHFIDWLDQQHGDTLIPDTLMLGAYGIVVRDDLNYLSRVLNTHGYAHGIEGAYADYGRYIVSHPQGYGEINATLKLRLQSKASIKYISTAKPKFTEQETYIQFKQQMPPLTMTSLLLIAGNTQNGLLVIDPTGTSGGKLSAVTYDYYSTIDSDYSTRPPIDENLSFPYTHITVQDFKRLGTVTKLEQFIINAHSTQEAQIDVIFYLLLPPPVLNVDDGMVSWSTAELGNIPPGFIKGYYVYANGLRLNDTPVPVPEGGAAGIFNDDRIKTGHQIFVTVVDQHDNQWPKEPTASVEALRLGTLRINNFKGLRSSHVSDPLEYIGSHFLNEPFPLEKKVGTENIFEVSRTAHREDFFELVTDCHTVIPISEDMTFITHLEYDVNTDTIDMVLENTHSTQASSQWFWTTTAELIAIPRISGEAFSGPVGTFGLSGEMANGHFTYYDYSGTVAKVLDEQGLYCVGIEAVWQKVNATTLAPDGNIEIILAPAVP
jgi:hypothetical protein